MGGFAATEQPWPTSREGNGPGPEVAALEGGGPPYFAFAAPRLNFVVNFSTRPAVSTRRFSPV